MSDDPAAWLIAGVSAVAGAVGSYVWTVSSLKTDLAALHKTIDQYNIEHRELHAEISRKLNELQPGTKGRS